MSQNVPLLAMFVLLCAPGLARSEEPDRTTNVPQIGSSYQGAGTGGMQDSNTRSSFTNLLPVYSISNRQNAYSSAQEKFHDFQSNHRHGPQQIPSYVLRPWPTSRLMTSLPHGSSPPEIDGINSPGRNSELRIGSSNQMMSSLDAAEQLVRSEPALSLRGDSLNEIPIYVIRPPYSGMASPTIANLAVLPQEQINPEIIRILQSLRLSQDRVPLVLVTSQYPSLPVDGPSNADSRINTSINFDGSPEGNFKPIMGKMIATHSSSGEEWYDEEVMKHEILIHGRRPPALPNLGRFAQVSPQLHSKSGVSPLAYESIVPMNNEHFVVPKGRNAPAGFLPAQRSTLPRMMMPQEYYPQTKDQVPTGFSESLRYRPIPQTRIPEHPITEGHDSPYDSLAHNSAYPYQPTQQPQFPRRFIPKPQQNPRYIAYDDSQDNSFKPQYLTYPSSDVQEPDISSYPSQQSLYPGWYDNQAPYYLQTPSSPSSRGRLPSTHDRPDVISQIGRSTKPGTPSQYPPMYHENLTGYPYTITKQLYPGQQTKYPFIQKFAQDHLKQPSYPYPPRVDSSDIAERSHFAPPHKYPEYPSRDSEVLGDYHDPQPIYPSQSSHFPSYRSPPAAHPYHPLPQYPPTASKHLPIKPRPNVHTQIEEFIVPEKQQPIPPDSYPKFPSESQDVPSNYHSLFPNQYDPDQKPVYPSGADVPIPHQILPAPSEHSYDDTKPNLEFRPEILSQTNEIYIPVAHPLKQIQFPPVTNVGHRAPYPYDTFPPTVSGQQPQNLSESPLPGYLNQVQGDPQYPLMVTDESTSHVNTLALPDQQPALSPDDQLSNHPKKETSSLTEGELLVSSRPEVDSRMEKFEVPEKFHPSPEQKYQQYSSPTIEKFGIHPERRPDEIDHHGAFPSDGQEKEHSKQPSDGDKPSTWPRADTDPGIRGIKVTEPISLKPQQKYPHFPFSEYDGPTKYPDVSHGQPYRGTDQDLPYDVQDTGYPRHPTDNTDPQMEPRANDITKIDKFNIPEPPQPKLHQQKYRQAPSSDTDAPTFYPDKGPRQQYRGIYPDFPYYDRLTNYPKQPTDDLEPRVDPRTEVVSKMETVSIPIQHHPKPQQKYPYYLSSSETEERIYYPDSGPKQHYRGSHGDSSFHDNVTDHPSQPTDGTEPRTKLRTEVVPKIENLSTPEELYSKFQQKHPQAPSSDTDEPIYYPDIAQRQQYRGPNTNFSYGDQVIGPKQPTENTERQKMEPRTELVTKIENFAAPERGYPNPKQEYSQAPPSDNDETSYYPGIAHSLPYRGTQPDPPIDGQAEIYPKQTIFNKEPQISNRPYTVSNIEQLGVPEQPYPIPKQNYPQIPSTDTDEPTYYPESGPEQSYKGIHPEIQLDDQAKGYPRQPWSEMIPRPDAIFKIEKFRIPNQPFPKTQQKYPLIPSLYTGEPTNDPETDPFGSKAVMHPDGYAYVQIPPDFPKQPMDHSEPIMRPHSVVVPELRQFGVLEEPDIRPQRRYPQHPSSDTDDTKKYAGQPSSAPTDGRISHYPKNPSGSAETSRPLPENFPEIGKFLIPEQYGHPRYRSPDADEPLYPPHRGIHQPNGQFPESGSRMPGYSGVEVDEPKDAIPEKKNPQYSSTGRDAPRVYPDEYVRSPSVDDTDDENTGYLDNIQESYLRHPSTPNFEPVQSQNPFPLQIPDRPIQQSLSDSFTGDVQNWRDEQYPSRYDQLKFPYSSPGFSTSTSTPLKPKTTGREVEPEEQVYSEKDISDIVAHVQKFKIPEVPHLRPPGQDYPQATLVKAEIQSVPGSDLRPSNDIDINFERLTVPGQPGPRYQQYDSTDNEQPDEYPETYSLYPRHRPQMQIKLEHHVPTGAERLLEKADEHSSSSPYRPLQQTPFPYSPIEQPERKYQGYPYKDIDSPSNQPIPQVTADLGRLSRSNYSHLLPEQNFTQHTSADYESSLEDPNYLLQYSPERKVPQDHKSNPSRYSLADQRLPEKQLQPDIKMRMERFQVAEPQLNDEQFQNLYTTTTPSLAQLPQYSAPPYYPSQSYPDYHQLQISRPIDQTNTYGLQPVGKQVQSLEGSYPADGYLPDGSRKPNIWHPTFLPDGKEPQHYQLDQSNYPQGITPGHPSSGSLTEEPKHLEKPTVFVYAVPRVPSIESYLPQLERRHSVPPQSEPFSSTAGTHDRAAIAGQTPVYAQQEPGGTSPQHDLQTTLAEPVHFLRDLSRSTQGQTKPSGPTKQVSLNFPGPVEQQELDSQTPIKVYVDETSSEPSIQMHGTTPIYPESLPTELDVSLISPAGTTVYPQRSDEQVTLTSTLKHPDEQNNQPSTATLLHPNPLEPNQFKLSELEFEGTPQKSIAQPDLVGGTPKAPDSPHDFTHTELQNGQASRTERFPPEGEPTQPTSSVNTHEFPYSTEGVNENKPVTLPSEDLERGFYSDDALTTTVQTTGTGSAPDELSIIRSTLVPQAVPTGKHLLGEPSSEVSDLPPQSSTSFEPSFPVPPDSLQSPINQSPLSDSKITRIYPVTKPTFYTDKAGQKFVSLKLLNEPISTSSTGDIVPLELNDSSRPPGTTELVIPIGQDAGESLPQNATQPHPMLKGIPIGNVQVFDAQTIIKVIESCNCSNLKFLIPILKRPRSAVVVANSEYPDTAN